MVLSLYRNPVKIARDNDHHFDQGYDDQLCAVPTTQSQSIVLATSSLAYSKQIYLEDYRKQFTLSSQLTNIVIVGVNSSMPILQDYEKFTQSEREYKDLEEELGDEYEEKEYDWDNALKIFKKEVYFQGFKVYSTLVLKWTLQAIAISTVGDRKGQKLTKSVMHSLKRKLAKHSNRIDISRRIFTTYLKAEFFTSFSSFCFDVSYDIWVYINKHNEKKKKGVEFNKFETIVCNCVSYCARKLVVASALHVLRSTVFSIATLLPLPYVIKALMPEVFGVGIMLLVPSLFVVTM